MVSGRAGMQTQAAWHQTIKLCLNQVAYPFVVRRAGISFQGKAACWAMCGTGSLWAASVCGAAHWGRCHPPRPKFPCRVPFALPQAPLPLSLLSVLAPTGCHYEEHPSFSTPGFKHQLCQVLAAGWLFNIPTPPWPSVIQVPFSCISFALF